MGADDANARRRAAFEAEALPHLSRLFAVARRLARSQPDAEDLVQETYLRAYRTYDGFVRGTNARAWLLTILYSVFANRWRRRRREPEPLDDDELEASAARVQAEVITEPPQLTAVLAGRWGAGERLSAALDRLPEVFRIPVILVDVDSLTYEEAAQVLDCPVGTVRSRLARGRRRLAADLELRDAELDRAAKGRS